MTATQASKPLNGAWNVACVLGLGMGLGFISAGHQKDRPIATALGATFVIAGVLGMFYLMQRRWRFTSDERLRERAYQASNVGFATSMLVAYMGFLFSTLQRSGDAALAFGLTFGVGVIAHFGLKWVLLARDKREFAD